MAGETKRERPAYWLCEANFQQAAEAIGLHEAALAAEAMKMQRA